MNIYNFIYSFFNIFWAKRGVKGSMVGATHVIFTIMMHVLLFTEVIWWLTGYRLIDLPDYGTSGINKTMYSLFILPFCIGLALFYNKNRTRRLLKIYHQKYEGANARNTLKVLLIVALPTILAITLAIIRQNT